MKPEAKWNPRRALFDMLSHASLNSPYYREQDWALGLRAGNETTFHEIPITPKAVVREQPVSFFCSDVPPSEGQVHDRATSGSTGHPMPIRKTDQHFHMQNMENLRLRRGWDYERHTRLALTSAPTDDHPNGRIDRKDLPGGRILWTLHSGDTCAAFDLLRETSATLVTSSPSIMLEVLQRSLETSLALCLELIVTTSELVPDELRELVRGFPGCRLMDAYGTVETGLIAVQCSHCGAYHPANRHLILEIVDDQGRAVRAGEMGRVIATPLFNRAMPLIRYDTGDYAVLGEPNGCPHSSSSISRIVGRERNLFKLPDGRKIVPRIPHQTAQDLALRQFKLIQTTITDIEMRYIPRDARMEIAQQAAQEMVDKYMARGFKVHCVKVSELPRAPSGKYLMHECLV